MLVETCRCVTGEVFRDGRWHGGGRPESGFGCTALSAGTRGVGATADGINKDIGMGIHHQAATVAR